VVEELAQAVNPLRVAVIRSFVLGDNNPFGDYPPLRHLRAPDLDIFNSPTVVESLDLRQSGLRSARPLQRFTNLQRLNLNRERPVCPTLLT
jgi:hypothetical protein